MPAVSAGRIAKSQAQAPAEAPARPRRAPQARRGAYAPAKLRGASGVGLSPRPP